MIRLPLAMALMSSVLGVSAAGCVGSFALTDRTSRTFPMGRTELASMPNLPPEMAKQLREEGKGKNRFWLQLGPKDGPATPGTVSVKVKNTAHTMARPAAGAPYGLYYWDATDLCVSQYSYQYWVEVLGSGKTIWQTLPADATTLTASNKGWGELVWFVRDTLFADEVFHIHSPSETTPPLVGITTLSPTPTGGDQVTIVLRNLRTQPVNVQTIQLTAGADLFSLIQPPSLPTTLACGQELELTLALTHLGPESSGTIGTLEISADLGSGLPSWVEVIQLVGSLIKS